MCSGDSRRQGNSDLLVCSGDSRHQAMEEFSSEDVKEAQDYLKITVEEAMCEGPVWKNFISLEERWFRIKVKELFNHQDDYTDQNLVSRISTLFRNRNSSLLCVGKIKEGKRIKKEKAVEDVVALVLGAGETYVSE